MKSLPPVRAVTAVLLGASLLLTGCSDADRAAGSGTRPDATSSSSSASSASAVQVDAEREAYLASAPQPFNPAAYDHADLIGALDIQYRGDRSSASAQASDAQYAAFFGGEYDPPAPGYRHVVRLVAFEDPVDAVRLLEQGAALDDITGPDELVVALHNVLDIDGAIELNGEVFEGRVGGAAGAMEVGDVATIWTQDLNYPDLVNRYDYEVVAAADGGGYAAVDSETGAEEYIYAQSPAEDVKQLTIYTCWPPNQLEQRMVFRLDLVSSSIQEGVVRAIDG